MANTKGKRYMTFREGVKFPLTGLIGSFVCLLVVACGETKDPSEPQRETVALFTKNQTNPYFQTVRVAAQAAAKEMNVDLELHSHHKRQHPRTDESDRRRHNQAPKRGRVYSSGFKGHDSGVEKFNASGIPVVIDHRAEGGSSFIHGCDDYAVAPIPRATSQKLEGKGML
jgi:ribose transport system substrate-binding protein